MVPLIFKAKLDGTELSTGLNAIAGRIQSRLAGLISAGAIVQFTRSIVDYASKIKDASEQTGINVETLQELSFAMRQVGGTQEDLINATRKLAMARQDALNGDEKAIQKFARLGITMNQLKYARVDELMMLTARGLMQIGDSSERLAMAAEFFERAAPKVFAMANDVERLRRLSRESGLIITDEEIARLDAFSKKWDAIVIKAKAAGAGVLNEVIGLFSRGDSKAMSAAVAEYRKAFGGDGGTLTEFASRVLGTMAVFGEKTGHPALQWQRAALANLLGVGAADPTGAIKVAEMQERVAKAREAAERRKRLEEAAQEGQFSPEPDWMKPKSDAGRAARVREMREAGLRLTALQAHGAYVSAADRTMLLANNVARQTQIQQNILATIKRFLTGFRII